MPKPLKALSLCAFGNHISQAICPTFNLCHHLHACLKVRHWCLRLRASIGLPSRQATEAQSWVATATAPPKQTATSSPACPSPVLEQCSAPSLLQMLDLQMLQQPFSVAQKFRSGKLARNGMTKPSARGKQKVGLFPELKWAVTGDIALED